MAGAETVDTAGLASLLDHVDIDQDRLQRYTVDGFVPRAATRAHSISDVEQTQSVATEHDFAVIVHGGRTMLGLGMPPRRYDMALDLSGLNQVVDYEPNDFTITVEAGMTLAELQRHLATNSPVPAARPSPFRACHAGRALCRRTRRAASQFVWRSSRLADRDADGEGRRHADQGWGQGRQERERLRPAQAVCRVAGHVGA